MQPPGNLSRYLSDGPAVLLNNHSTQQAQPSAGFKFKKSIAPWPPSSMWKLDTRLLSLGPLGNYAIGFLFHRQQQGLAVTVRIAQSG